MAEAPKGTAHGDLKEPERRVVLYQHAQVNMSTKIRHARVERLTAAVTARRKRAKGVPAKWQSYSVPSRTSIPNHSSRSHVKQQYRSNRSSSKKSTQINPNCSSSHVKLKDCFLRLQSALRNWVGTSLGWPCSAFCSRARLSSLSRPRPIPSQSRPSEVLSVEATPVPSTASAA